MSVLPQNRVPHLRDGFIVVKVAIARKRDRFRLPNPKLSGISK
jgi:hypothetical protein